MEVVGYCGALVTLAVLTAEDIREKRLSMKRLVVFGTMAGLFCMLRVEFCFREMGRNFLPGIALLLLSFVTKESIGFGDGIAVIILGFWTGLYFTLAVVCAGILAAGVYGMVCLIRKRKDPFPFLPFLLFGMEVVLLGI